jgi:hypothetical protein
MFNNYAMVEIEGTTLVVDHETKKAKMLYDYSYEGRVLVFDEEDINKVLAGYGMSVSEIISHNTPEAIGNEVYCNTPAYLMYKMEA